MAGRVVVVGASAAGISVAQSLQRLGADREVVIVGDEPAIAHDRPPLSKQVLEGAWTADQAKLLPAARQDLLGARLMLGHQAVSLDVRCRELTLDDGAVLPFDDLVIATGVRPRTLGGVTPRGVHVLRTLEQSMALRRAMLLGGRGHVVIVGGGFIGLEVAATARKLDVDVTIIEPNPGLLSSRLGSEAADRLRGLHGTHDVRMIIGTGVAGYLEDGNSTVRGLVLSDGTTFEASVVLLAIGSQPNVEWLAGSGLDVTDGVRCDATCLAAPGIWAAGDVARWYHAGLGREIRVEHRLNATEQGLVVAENLVGTPRAFTPTPFFWTDQYDARIQVAGLPTSDSEEHGEQLGPDSFLHSYSVEGRLTAVLGWNAAKAMMPLRRELTASHSELVSS